MASPYLTAPIEGGKYYHICKKSSHFGPVFYVPSNYPFFLKRFQTLLGPMVDLMAYCLLPDRFHFVFFAREVILLKEEYVDHPGDIGHFISETLRKLFGAYTLTILKQEGLPQETVVLDQNFFRYEVTNDDDLRSVIAAVHHLPIASSLAVNLNDYPYSSLPGLLAKGKAMTDKEAVFGLFGDLAAFEVAVNSSPIWQSSPLFELMEH